MPCTGNDYDGQAEQRGWRYKPTHWLLMHFPSLLLDNPWGILVKLAAVVASSLILFVPAVTYPATVDAMLSGPWARAWAWLLLVGGTVGLIGYFSRPSWDRGWRLEVAGLFMFGFGCLAYAITVGAYFGFGRATFASLAFAFIATAAFLRALAVHVAGTAALHRQDIEDGQEDAWSDRREAEHRRDAEREQRLSE
jgi:hypothetical protein